MGNRYLDGAYAPVREEFTTFDLAVTGTLPPWLDGRYLRNGPNPMAADPATYHWFTGEGMVHGIRLRDGSAQWYRNRWVRSRSVAEALGEPAPGGPVSNGMDFACNTNVIGHAGRAFAIVEAGSLPYELNEELDTLGSTDLGGLTGYTAHPKRDPATGELHAVSYHWGWGEEVRYSVIDAEGTVRRTVAIPTTGSPMLHDCALTESNVLIFDLPCDFDLDAAMGGAELPYRWKEGEAARVGVLPRHGDAVDIRWCEVEPCYVFHTLNAYDDGDRVVLDVIRHDRMFATDLHGPNEGPPTLERWLIDPTSGKVIEETLDDRPQEFPRGDERRLGSSHRYGWTVALTAAPDGSVDFGANALIRHDLAKGGSTRRQFGPSTVCGEFIYLTPDEATPEGEGVVMGLVYDADRNVSDLMVLDAASLETLATVHLPARVPNGFHGNWLPA